MSNAVGPWAVAETAQGRAAARRTPRASRTALTHERLQEPHDTPSTFLTTLYRHHAAPLPNKMGKTTGLISPRSPCARASIMAGRLAKARPLLRRVPETPRASMATWVSMFSKPSASVRCCGEIACARGPGRGPWQGSRKFVVQKLTTEKPQTRFLKRRTTHSQHMTFHQPKKTRA